MPANATPESYHGQQCVRQPFLCAAYMESPDGPHKPSSNIDRCPLAADGQRCQLRTHSYRPRKTDPCIPLRVLHCQSHGRHFTVYPPGYVPHARRSLAVVDLPGEPIERLEPEPDASCRGVLFEAPLDAANGQRWESEPLVEFSKPRYPTQRRHIERCGQLLGLAPQLPEPVVEEIRDYLDLDGVEHLQARTLYQATSNLQVRGAAIVDVHQRIHRDRSLVQRLLAAGSVSGLWGHPWLWDTARGQRFSLLSRTSWALRYQ